VKKGLESMFQEIMTEILTNLGKASVSRYEKLRGCQIQPKETLMKICHNQNVKNQRQNNTESGWE
jgi:hypothetical protein